MARVKHACLSLLWLAACGQPPLSTHAPLEARAADQKLEQIPARPVTGTLRGEAFRATDARVRVVTMPGRQRVDLLLSDTKIERCGLPLPSRGRRVWLRVPGTPKLDGTVLRAEAGQRAALGTHYELRTGARRQWLGHEGGAALLSLTSKGFGEYEGALWTCFDDADKSCVAGRFTATECRSELDVDDSVWGAARVTAEAKQQSAR